MITREQTETQINEDEIFRQARERVKEKTSTSLRFARHAVICIML